MEAYTEEDKLWIVDKQIANSAGNLALHLFGNLRHFIGLDFGGIPYQRNREREFGAKGEPKSALFDELEEVKKIVETVLLNLNPSRLGDKSLHAFFWASHVDRVFPDAPLWSFELSFGAGKLP
ncbi:hypothetical protein [Algoriphagus boritolerans]|uniref:hypothetical protein n=1 Tax=Algoriphagus boritolerans TaxID=308111 RepID=UPI002FCDE61C